MFITLVVATALQGAALGPVCYDGVLGEGARARRVILELTERGATAHFYGRPARTVGLDAQPEGAGPTSRRLVSGDGNTRVYVASDSATINAPSAGGVATGTLRRGTSNADYSRLAGEWHTRVGPGGVIRLIARMSAGPCGLLTGVFDSPDQGQTDLPMTAIHVTARALVLTAAYMDLRIEVPLDGGDERAGSMHQNGMTTDITLRRGVAAPALRRPQEPTRPVPYVEREVRFDSRAAGIRISGALTIPASPGPHPAIILISGSGAQDRDETIAGHRPFLVLSDYLTRRGYAVLRTDDRGVGATGGTVLNSNLDDIADDVRGALDFLRTIPELDDSRIGLLGHSEGGYVAPIVAATDERVAFMALLGAGAQPGRELMLSQRASLTRASGDSAPQVRIDSMMIAEIFEVLDTGPSDDELPDAVDSALRAWISRLEPAERAIAETLLARRSAGQDSASVTLWRSRWFKGLYQHDARRYLRAINVPTFALIGALDMQVPPGANLELFRSLFSGARSHLLTVLSPAGVNHMLQPAMTGRMDEYAEIETTIAPAVLDALGSWLDRASRAGSARRTSASSALANLRQ